MNRAGRIERSVEAHKGAVLVGQWGNDGTSLLTGELFYLQIINMFNYNIFDLHPQYLVNFRHLGEKSRGNILGIWGFVQRIYITYTCLE